jgi:hypothetical protein
MVTPAGGRIRVFVDAKITGIHDESLKRRAYVGYFVEGSGLHEETVVEADETDDAEIQAILFAIDRVAGKQDRITVVCDHQSVVSEAKRKTIKNPNPLLEILRKVLRAEAPSVDLEAMEYNLAHGTLTKFVNDQSRVEG